MAQCKFCGREDAKIQTDYMWRVMGQVGMSPEAIVVHECLDCGRKWKEA